MEPSTDRNTPVEFFAELTADLFKIPNMSSYYFDDGVSAMAFLHSVDELIENYLYVLEEQKLDLQPTIVLHIGCVVGEAYKMIFGGEWFYNETVGRWIVQITMPNNDKLEVNVFSKVMKRFENGEEDSIAYMFENVRGMYLEQMKDVEEEE